MRFRNIFNKHMNRKSLFLISFLSVYGTGFSTESEFKVVTSEMLALEDAIKTVAASEMPTLEDAIKTVAASDMPALEDAKTTIAVEKHISTYEQLQKVSEEAQELTNPKITEIVKDYVKNFDCTDEKGSSSQRRWKLEQHFTGMSFEVFNVLKSLKGLIEKGLIANDDPQYLEKTFDFVLSYVGGARQMWAGAIRDTTHNSFGKARDDNGLAFTPIGTYPLMYKMIKERLKNEKQSLLFDGEWHDYDNDFKYRINCLSLLDWLKWSIQNPIDGLAMIDRIKMIIYGDKNSIGGAAGVFLQDITTEDGKKTYLSSGYLIDNTIKDLEILDAPNNDDCFAELQYYNVDGAEFSTEPRVKIGCLEMAFKTPLLPTRKFFWVQDETGETDELAITLLHPSGPVYPLHLEMTRSMFNQALKAKDADTLTKRIAVARFMYMYSLTMPFPRGSAFTNEWIGITLYNVLGLEKIDREELKKYDEYSQGTLSFKEYLKLVLPDVNSDDFNLLDTTEDRVAIVETTDEKWSNLLKDFKVQMWPALSDKTDLCKFMLKEGSDKNSMRHTYTQLYNYLLEPYKDKATHVLEIGIGSCNPEYGFTMGPTGTVGASLRAYRNFFPSAQIYGADIDKEALFNEDRIQCFWLDGLKPPTIQTCFEEMNVQFDYIVDDGFHDFTANRNCVLEGMKHLKQDGLYIIEDVRTDQLPRFEVFFRDELQNYVTAIVKLPAFYNTYDNNVILVRHKDQ